MPKNNLKTQTDRDHHANQKNNDSKTPGANPPARAVERNRQQQLKAAKAKRG